MLASSAWAQNGLQALMFCLSKFETRFKSFFALCTLSENYSYRSHGFLFLVAKLLKLLTLILLSTTFEQLGNYDRIV